MARRKYKPKWGAPKIRERLRCLYPDVHTPAISTFHAVLDRHGLVKRRKRPRRKANCAFTVIERAFKDFGLPRVIRSKTAATNACT